MLSPRVVFRHILFLAVLPALAVPAVDASSVEGTESPPPCALSSVGVATAEFLGGSPTDPIPFERSLFVELAELAAQPIEVRYLVDGEIYLVESADLGEARPAQRGHPRAGLPEGMTWSGPAVGPDVLELLTLRPDVVRRLHRMVGEGREVRLEIFQGERPASSLTFAELEQLSDRLRERGGVPVHVLSDVRGPGAVVAPMLRPRSANGCGVCTPTSACDDPGPYDDGKGGCVSCGEYGECDPGGCDCSKVINTYWTSWFVTNTNYIGPHACVDRPHPVTDSRAYRAEVTYRRNQVQVTRTCPNCPSCAGCNNTQAVINHQTQIVTCYIDQHLPCLVSDFVIGAWQLCS